MKEKDKMGKQEPSKTKKKEVRTFSGFLNCVNSSLSLLTNVRKLAQFCNSVLLNLSIKKHEVS